MDNIHIDSNPLISPDTILPVVTPLTALTELNTDNGLQQISAQEKIENYLTISPETLSPNQVLSDDFGTEDLLTGQASNNSLVGQANNTVDVLQTTIPKNIIIAGLDSFIDWTNTLEDFDKLATNLPIAINQNLGDFLNINNLLEQGFFNPISNYFTTDSTPTAEELVDVLKNLSQVIGNVEITVDPALVKLNLLNNGVQFDLKLQATKTQAVDIDLNAEAENLKLQGNNQVALAANFLLDFSFGFQNNPSNSSNEFFIKVEELTADGQIKANNLNLNLNYGLLGTQIQNGIIDLDTKVDVDVEDPNSDGIITVFELNNTPINNLVDLGAIGNYNIELPIQIANTSFKPKVIINDINIFDGTLPTFTYSNFEKLEFLKDIQLDTNQISFILQELGNGLQNLLPNFNLEDGIPFISEEFDEIINLTSIFTDLGKGFLEKSLAGSVNLNPTGKLSNDAVFYVEVNDNNQQLFGERAFKVGIKVDRDSNNQSIDDLIIDINTALQKAGISSFVEARQRDGKIILKTINTGDSLKIIELNSIAVNELGLTEGQTAQLINFKFKTLWNLVDILPDKNAIALQLNLNRSFKKDINLDFEKIINTQLGELSFLGQAEGNLASSANFDLGLILDLNPLGSNFNLTNSTLLSQLKPTKLDVNQPFNNIPGKADIRITLSDGTSQEIDFDGDVTVGDAIASITNSFGQKLTVEIDNINKSLKLKDNTTGDSHFSVVAINGSLAGFRLGIVDFDSEGFIIGGQIGNNLQFGTQLSSLGITIPANQADLKISLSNGEIYIVDLTINQNTTLQDIANAIQQVTQNKVIISLNETGNSLKLQDKSNGSNLFFIESLNGSLLGESLGIIASSNTGIIVGTPITQYAATQIQPLNDNTQLVTLNLGRGVRVLKELEDLAFNLQDGSTIKINFTGDEQTIGDLINLITQASGGKVIATINVNETGLELIDTTTGGNPFSILSLNDSLAAFDLGILGVNSSQNNGRIIGKAINPILSLSTNLSAINNGEGVINTESDIEITLRDGTKFEVDFNNSQTINDIITTIKNASPVLDKIDVIIYQSPDQSQKQLALIDKTLGSGKFTITAINNSLVGQLLKILGSDTDNTIIGEVLHGDSQANHLYLTDDSKIKISGQIISNNIDLSTALGIVQIGIQDGTANFNFSAEAILNDPTPNDLGISQNDLFSNNISAIVEPSYTTSGEITLPLNFKGLDVLGLTNPTNAKLKLNFTSSADKPIDFTTYFEEIESIQSQLSALKNLSTDDLLKLVNQAITFLSDQDLSLLNQKIPLLNQSLNDLLSFLKPIQDSYNEITDDLKNLQSNLSNKISYIEEKIFEPTFLNLLTPNLLEKLQNAFAILENAVEQLPTNLDALTTEIPAQLLSAIGEFQEVILSLPSAAIADLKNNLNQAIDSLPNNIDKSKINQAKAQFYQAIDQFANNPSAFKPALEQFKLELATILDATTALQLAAFRSIVNELKTASTKDLEGLLNILDTEIAKLPNNSVTTTIKAAQTKLEQAYTTLNFSLLTEGIDDLSSAVTQFPNPAIGQALTNIEIILGKFTGTLLKVTFDQFIEQVPTLSTIEQFLADLLNTDEISLAFDSQNNLILQLDWNLIEQNKTVPLDFALQQGNTFIPISLTTNGTLEVDLDADINLDFGFSLLNPQPNLFLLPSTEFNLKAGFNVNNFSAEASLGLINAELGKGGTGSLSLANGNALASFIIDLKNPVYLIENGQIQIPDLSSNNIDFVTQGQINLNLPLTICGDNIGALTANVNNLEQVLADPSSFQIQYPNNFTDKLLKADCLNYGVLIDGIYKLLDILEKNLIERINDLPIIGDKIDFANSFIQKLREKFLDPIKEILENPTGQIEQELQQIIFNNLSPLGIIQDNDGNGSVTSDDVIVNIDETTQALTIDLHLGGVSTLSSDFDLGLQGLGLKIDTQGGIEINLGYDFKFILGASAVEGFFFKLPDGTDFNFTLDVELAENTSIEGKLFLLEVEAKNAVLNEATSDNDYNQDGQKDDIFTTGFDQALALKFDLIGDTNDDQKITLDELSNLSIDGQLKLPTSLTIALHLKAGLGNDSLPSIVTDLFVQWPLSDLAGDSGDLKVGLYDISLDAGEFISKVLGPIVKTVNTYIEPLRPILDFVQQEVPIISPLTEALGLGKFTVIDAIALYGDGGDTVAEVLRIVVAVNSFVEKIKSFEGNVLLNYGDLVFDQDLRFSSTIELSKNTFQKTFNNYNQAINAIANQSQAASGLIEDVNDNKKGLGITFPIFENPSSVLEFLFGGNPTLVLWDIPKLEARFDYMQSIPIFPPYPVFATIGAGLVMFADLSVGFDTRGLRTGNFLDGFYFGDYGQNGRETPELQLGAFFAVGAQVNIVVAAVGVEGGVIAKISADWNDIRKDGKVYFDEIEKNARRNWMCIFDFKGELGAFFDAYLQIGYDPIIVYQNRIPLFYLPLFSFSKTCSPTSSPDPSDPLAPPEPSPTLGHYSTGEGEDAGIEKGTLIVHVGRFAHLRQPGVSRDTDEEVFITRLKSGALEIHSPFRTDYRQNSDDPHPTGAVQVFGDDANEPIATKIYIDAAIGDDYIQIDDLVTAEVTIIGGIGDDTIKAGNGTKYYIEGGADDDLIISGSQDDTLIGGVSGAILGQDGKDTIVGGGGNDLVFGDNGSVSSTKDEEDLITLIESLATNNGDDDIIFVGTGDDTVIGGLGDDRISGALNNSGNDILLGDHGTVKRKNNTVTDIDSIAFADGGNDTITAGLGSDTAIGGAQDDRVTNDADISQDILFGDQGHWDAQNIYSLSAPASDGNDTLFGEGANDTIIAGGANDFVSGAVGEDILFGDHGKIEQQGGIITRIFSTDFTNGGNDTLAASQNNDTVIGGAKNDLITNEGDTLGQDILYGDQGYWDASLISAPTDANDGNDTIYGEGANDSILGGGAQDYIAGSSGLDIIFGDHGKIHQVQGVINLIETATSTSGDHDTIEAGNDDDTVFGGPKNDSITGDTDNNGDDILVGDQGYWTPNLIVSLFDASSNPDGNDTIFGNSGQDTILGSDGKDYIEGNQGLDIALGDYGKIDHLLKTALRINTTEVEKGNDDYIHGGDLNDTLIGGTAHDSLYGGLDNGEDILMGDNGTVVNDDGSLQSNDIFSHSPLYGGLDRMAGGAGNDTLIGGSGGKDTTDPKATTLTGKSGDGLNGNEGDDIAIGDNAYITRNSDRKNERIETTLTNYGGDDQTLGESGNDILIGGYGKDSASGNDGNDFILGDNARFDYLIDNNLSTLDLVTATDVTLGDKDTLTGDGGNDLLIGGTKEDSLLGGAGNELIFGDHGKVEGNINLNALPLAQTTPPFTFTAIATQQQDLGGSDFISGGGDADIILGQQGNDRLFGDEGDDDLIGGHNIAGSYDGGDTIDGGTGNDVLAGDNAAITRRSDTISPRWRVLSGQTLYDANGNPQITSDSQSDPQGLAGRNIVLFDHATSTKAGTYGNDSLAGGANHDLIFGQLGNDTIQGDSTTNKKVSATIPSIEGADDGDDYIEGGGGQDLIFGNLGQDDIIGGSSSLYGTPLASDRPDAGDTLLGGAGTKIALNDPGNATATGHAQDADTILGDNGNIFRLVNNQGTFLSFTYDNYSNSSKILPRVFQLLDYTAGSNSNNLGGNDLIHGEGGDDEIHGMTGNDVIFGQGQDDNLYGGIGHDRLYGGTGEDGIIGDDGLIYTSRNGQTETLYGVTTANSEVLVSIPNSLIGAYVNLKDRLKKEARLLALTSGGNDIIYGGLGDDFLHGGAGDDAISGAEALLSFYNSNPITNNNPLGYNATTGKFAAYDANKPRVKVNNFLLNFETLNAQNKKIDDGKDSIFGDDGNDWIVGGTQSDRLFGGQGNDLLNADDNHDTNNGLNNQPDNSSFTDADFTFGGDGLDVLIANTGKDRLIDWFKNCNTYVVPFSFFDTPTITFTPSEAMTQFLINLGAASGSDPTQSTSSGELGLVVGDDPNCTPRDPDGTLPGMPVDNLGAIEDDRMIKG